jgi:hypothetical protein
MLSKKERFFFFEKKKQKTFPLINQATRACTTRCFGA